MRTTKLFITVMALMLSYGMMAQVAINTDNTTANSSAMLDVKSTTKGMLIPRMTTAQRTAISSPADGLMVYDETTNNFWFYDSGNSGWTELVTTAGANELDDLSDAKTDATSVFIGSNSGSNDDGSNDNVALGISALNDNINGRYNSAIGKMSAYSNTSGDHNVAFGIGTLYYNSTGSNNTAIGSMAGVGSSGNSVSGCIMIGYEAGRYNSSDNKLYIDNCSTSSPLIGGDFSTNQVDINGTIKITGGSPGVDKVLTSDANGLASWETIGDYALNDLSDAYTDASNIFVGAQVGTNDNGDNYNTVFGDEAFKTNVSGQHNTAFGYKTLELSTGESNTAFGLSGLRKNSTGANNVGVGFETMFYNQTGSNNTAIGYQSGRSTSGNSFSGCVFIGNQAGKSNTSSNKLFISNTDDTTPLIGGDFSTNELYFNTTEVGIGTDSPNEELEVAGLSGNSARMIVSDGMGSNRNVILFVSPNSSDNFARIEAFKYGTAYGGRTLKINTTGDGNVIIGGNVLPEVHKGKDLGANGTAWDDVYADDFVNQGAAAFANIIVTKQLLLFPPQEKKEGAFDEFTDKGAKELDPSSLPESLTQENGILIDEMTTYNYKANYEQQQQIEVLKAENEALKLRLERLEAAMLQSSN